MKNNLESLLNDVSEIKNALNDIRALLMNTKAKVNAQKPLKTAINASLFLNTSNKTSNPPSKDYLFDLSRIEYCEDSWLTFSEFYEACCLDKSVLKNHFSKYFKETRFFLDNDVRLSRKGNTKVVKNIRLRLDNSEQQL